MESLYVSLLDERLCVCSQRSAVQQTLRLVLSLRCAALELSRDAALQEGLTINHRI